MKPALQTALQHAPLAGAAAPLPLSCHCCRRSASSNSESICRELYRGVQKLTHFTTQFPEENRETQRAATAALARLQRQQQTTATQGGWTPLTGGGNATR